MKKALAVVLMVMMAGGVAAPTKIAYTFRDKDDSGYVIFLADKCVTESSKGLIKPQYQKYFHELVGETPKGQKFTGCWGLEPNGKVGMILDTGLVLEIGTDQLLKGGVSVEPLPDASHDDQGSV